MPGAAFHVAVVRKGAADQLAASRGVESTFGGRASPNDSGIAFVSLGCV